MIQKNVFQKAHEIIITYFIWMSPIGLVVILGSIGPSIDLQNLSASSTFQIVAVFAFLAWIVSSFYFFGSLMLCGSLRERVLAKLAGVHEKDEREEYIVGRAARSTFLLSLALLIVLFTISTWRYGESIEHPAEFQSLTVGHFHMKTNSEESLEKQFDENGVEHTVKKYDLPFSKSALIMSILLAQCAAYSGFARIYAKKV